MFQSLSSRILVPEKMDDPALDPSEHLRALTGLSRINRLARTPAILTKPILKFAQERKLENVKLLDIASGGGEVPITVARKLQSSGLHVDLTLFDQSPVGLERAKVLAAKSNVAVATQTGDATASLPPGPFDVVTCSLFLHHLTPEQVVAVLNLARQSCCGLLLILDLARSRSGLLATWAICHLVTRSRIVHYDGLVSARAAFTPTELKDLAIQAQLSDARISPLFPARMLLEWHRA